MKRRQLMLLLGSATIASPLAVRAQQKSMPVIGYLNGTSRVPGETSLAAFHQGLTEAGYIEGQMLRSNTAGPRGAMIGWPHWPPTSSAARST